MGNGAGRRVLLRLLRYGSADSREFAANNLAPYSGPSVVDGLERAAEQDSEELVRIAAIESLGQIGAPGSAAFLQRMAGTSIGAVSALADMGEYAILLQISEEHPKWQFRHVALSALCRPSPTHPPDEAVRRLIESRLDHALEDPVWQLRAHAAECARYVFETGDAVTRLRGLLRDPLWEVRLTAVGALGELGDRSGYAVAAQAISARHLPMSVRVGAVFAVINAATTQEICALLPPLESNDTPYELRDAAGNALSRRFPYGYTETCAAAK